MRPSLAFFLLLASSLLGGCYESHLFSGASIDGGDEADGFVPPFDGSGFDGGGVDGGGFDGGGFDAGPFVDGGHLDAGHMDGGRRDGGPPRDGGPRPDGGRRDGGPPRDGGRPSRALRFVGGDRLFSAHTPTLDLVASHTVELWVRARGDGAVIRKGELTDARHHLRVSVEGGEIVAGWSTVSGATLVRAPFMLGAWTHIAVVVQATPTTAVLTLYVNATAAATLTAPNTLFGALNDRPLALGGFDGDIDEVRIFLAARTAAEIADTMTTRLSPIPPSTEVYWPLEESGQIVLDRTLRGHDGVLGSFTIPDSADPMWITDGPI